MVSSEKNKTQFGNMKTEAWSWSQHGFQDLGTTTVPFLERTGKAPLCLISRALEGIKGEERLK